MWKNSKLHLQSQGLAIEGRSNGNPDVIETPQFKDLARQAQIKEMVRATVGTKRSPEEAHVNDFTDSSLSYYSYANVDDAASFMYEAGQETLSANLEI